jgi:hypothetical protein
MKRHYTIPALLLLGAVSLIMIAPIQGATLRKSLNRPFDSRLYHPRFLFFNSDSSEAVLTFSSMNGFCPEVASSACSTDSECSESAFCESGFCQQHLDVDLGYVAIVEKTAFCQKAACSGLTLSECGGITCDGSGFDDGLCAIDCDETDPDWSTVSSADVVLVDDFDSPKNPWILSHANQLSETDSFGERTVLRLGVDPRDPDVAPEDVPDPSSVTFANLRLGLKKNTDYALFIKHTFVPFDSGLRCSPIFELSVDLQTLRSERVRRHQSQSSCWTQDLGTAISIQVVPADLERYP